MAETQAAPLSAVDAKYAELYNLVYRKEMVPEMEYLRKSPSHLVPPGSFESTDENLEATLDDLIKLVDQAAVFVEDPDNTNGFPEFLELIDGLMRIGAISDGPIDD